MVRRGEDLARRGLGGRDSKEETRREEDSDRLNTDHSNERGIWKKNLFSTGKGYDSDSMVTPFGLSFPADFAEQAPSHDQYAIHLLTLSAPLTKDSAS
jgi:hypothetical protein